MMAASDGSGLDFRIGYECGAESDSAAVVLFVLYFYFHFPLAFVFGVFFSALLFSVCF